MSLSSLLNSLRKSDEGSMAMSSNYTLYVHYDETEEIAEDELAEPAAFQIPASMKWRDLQDLIHAEVGNAADSGFIYYDDETDEIRIDSQEEYETALHICRKDRRDLHIYSLQRSHKSRKHRRKRRKSIEKKQLDDEFAVIPADNKPQQQQDEDEDDAEPIDVPPVEVEQQQSNDQPEASRVEEPAPPPYGGATAASFAHPAQEETVTSTADQTQAEEETTPMPAGHSIINTIKKEVHEAIADELDDVWRFVNALKRDINAELDVIGDQLTAHSAQIPEVQRIKEQLSQTDTSPRESESSASEASLEPEVKEEEVNFAATFICESLLDGSRVQTGESFQKHWVFRNDGNAKWDDSTKLHLLDENCIPPVASGTSLSEWGAKSKSVVVPPLKQGESGVVCAEHTAPAHGCNYTSSWRLSHKNNPFGPRVWCNVRVENESGTPVDNEKSMGSFEDLHAEGTTPMKSLERTTELKESLHGSLVPADKVEVAEVKSPKADDGHHSDNSIRSFNMTDISDGAKYIETGSHETTPYNPAVTSVEEHQEREALHVSLEQKEDVGASVDGEDHSVSSASPVLVTPPDSEEKILHEPEYYELEEPRTLENEQDSDEEEDDLYSSKYEEKEAPEPQVENHVENFTEQVVRTPDQDYSSEEEEEEEEPEPVEVKGHERQNSGDLHSVDYNLDDDTASMMSYASDFVVVPLPECFDVNKPLTESQYEKKKEEEATQAEPRSVASDSPTLEEHPVQDDVEKDEQVEEGDPPPQYRLHDDPDSEDESQPPSVTRAAEYHSEDSIVSTTTAPKTPVSPPLSLTTPKVLAPNFVPLEKDTQIEKKEPQAPETPQSDSMDDSLTEKITKEFDAFLSNPQNPINPPATKPKIPMNQIPTSSFKPDPKPVPQSVLTMDDPYPFAPAAEAAPYFPPFEQGWRRNPIPVPQTVTNNEPWPLIQNKPTPAPRVPTQVPKSQFNFEQNTEEPESALPFAHPFAVASPSNSILSPEPTPQPRRPPSPQIPIADDFYPPGLEAAGSNLQYVDLEEPHEGDIFRTPPPSPPPRGMEVELSPLDQLYEMGFHDLQLNQSTYDQCGQDLNRTVQALVLRAEADEEMMA